MARLVLAAVAVLLLGALPAVLLWARVFNRKVRRVAQYAREVSQGRPPEFPPSGRLSRPLAELVAVIDDTAQRLRRRAHEALEEKKRVLAVIESMAEGVLVVDPDKKILLINSVLAGTFGSGKEQAEGRYFWEVVRDADINAMIETGLSKRAALRQEHTVLFSGAVFQIQVSPVLMGEEFLGIAAVFHDVSKLKELERFRSEFIANVSHELKTPLTSILGYVETLKEGAIDDAGNRTKFLGVIEDHAKKLHALIGDLMKLSRVESGAEPLAVEKVDLSGLLRHVLAAFDRPIRERKIHARLVLPDEPVSVFGDPGLLEQAVSNLVDNAVKYNRDGGGIILAGEPSAEHVQIRVEDTGVGIPEKDLPRVFERFFRVEKSRDRQTGGTGLGLSIAKHIMERHGGRIEAESRPGRGSVFTILLPFTKTS